MMRRLLSCTVFLPLPVTGGADQEKLAASFHVYVLDMRNHGASPHHPSMDYLSMAADLLRVMESRLKISQFTRAQHGR